MGTLKLGENIPTKLREKLYNFLLKKNYIELAKIDFNWLKRRGFHSAIVVSALFGDRVWFVAVLVVARLQSVHHWSFYTW